MTPRIIPSKKSLTTICIFLIFFLPTACFVFWRCPYGFGNIDEGFYLTIPYRLILGDALFVEEWHLSQMAGILTMPFVSLYLKLNGSTEGIILAMRYIYTFIQCVCAVFIFLRLKNIHPLGAILSSISFLLYTPFGIMALSYNSMGILFLSLSLVIITTAINHKYLQYSFSGLLFAAAVLCCPYLLAVYILYLILVAVSIPLRRRNVAFANDPILSINGALSFTSGAAIAAALFAAFVLTRGSLRDIIQAFGPLLNDPEHPPLSLPFKTYRFFKVIFCENDWTPHLYRILIFLGIICLWVRKHRQFVPLMACAIGIVILFLQFRFFNWNHYINHLMWSANVFAAFIFLLSNNKQIYRLFFYIWIPGMLYAYCLHLSSNQEFAAISSASSVSTVASILIICQFVDDLLHSEDNCTTKKVAIALIGIFLVAQFYTQVNLRHQLVFWDSEIDNLTTKITVGIEKGLYTTEENSERYHEQLGYLGQLSEYKHQNVLYLSDTTWYYLQNENQMSTYSAWLTGVNEHSLDRLEIYYHINPHKLPVAVFADNQHEEGAIMFCQRFSYDLHPINGGYLLLPQ